MNWNFDDKTYEASGKSLNVRQIGFEKALLLSAQSSKLLSSVISSTDLLSVDKDFVLYSI